MFCHETLRNACSEVQLDVVKGVGNEIRSLTMDPDDIGGRSGQVKRWVTKLAYRWAWALSLAVVIVVVVACTVSTEQDRDKNWSVVICNTMQCSPQPMGMQITIILTLKHIWRLIKPDFRGSGHHRMVIWAPPINWLQKNTSPRSIQNKHQGLSMGLL